MINGGKVFQSKLSTQFLIPSSSSSSSSSSLSSSTLSFQNNHYKMAYFVVFIIISSCMVLKTDGCYLRNCPLGKWEGKRSNGESLYDRQQQPTKLCPSCGPVGNGRCIGPNICCIPGQGCLIGKGLPFTLECSREEENPFPCIPEGIPCGERGERICGNEGICCNEESCSVSLECTSLNPMVVDILKILRGF